MDDNDFDIPRCFVCGRTRWLENHHIFGSSNRKWSEKYGLKILLCNYCHRDHKKGNHHNKELRVRLHQYGQRLFEERYPDLDFMQIFRRNYL